MKRVLLLIVVAVISLMTSSACRFDRIILASPDTIHDTISVAHVDTLIVIHFDTLRRVDTLPALAPLPPLIDTVQIIRQHTDTLFLPSAVVHDTTWIYLQGSPTNPLGGGDPHAALAYFDTGFGQSLVFWHGNFVGTVIATANSGGGYWDAYIYTKGGGQMPWRGQFKTKLEAIQALVPIILNLT